MRRNPTHAVLKLEGTTHGFTTSMNRDRRAPRGGAHNPKMDWLAEYQEAREDNPREKIPSNT